MKIFNSANANKKRDTLMVGWRSEVLPTQIAADIGALEAAECRVHWFASQYKAEWEVSWLPE